MHQMHQQLSPKQRRLRSLPVDSFRNEGEHRLDEENAAVKKVLTIVIIEIPKSPTQR
jgi:hypothetical protein